MKPSDFATREEWVAAERALIEKQNMRNSAAEEKWEREEEQRHQDRKKQLKISFYTFDLNIANDLILEWFTKFIFKKPDRMYIATIKRAKPIDKKYNEEVFLEAIRDEKIKSTSLKHKDFPKTSFDNDGSLIEFSTAVDAEVWNDRKDEILCLLNDFFLRINGAFGMIQNVYEACVIHGSFYHKEDILKFDDSDYPGIRELPLIRDEYGDVWHIDPAYLPSSEVIVGALRMRAAPYMWIGPGLADLFPKNIFKKFGDCEENVELSTGFRRITLFGDALAYNNPILRKNQWAFKKKTCFEKVLSTPKNEKYILQIKDNGDSVEIEFKSGSFPHGGDLLAIFYLNEKGQSCSKGGARWQVVREMKGNEIVWHEKNKIN